MAFAIRIIKYVFAAIGAIILFFVIVLLIVAWQDNSRTNIRYVQVKDDGINENRLRQIISEELDDYKQAQEPDYIYVPFPETPKIKTPKIGDSSPNPVNYDFDSSKYFE